MNEFLFNLLVHTFSTRCNEFSITGKIHIEDRARVSLQRANHPRMRELLLRFASLFVFSTFVATAGRPNRSARRISWFFELHFIRFCDIWKDKIYYLLPYTIANESNTKIKGNEWYKCLRTYHRRIVKNYGKREKDYETEFPRDDEGNDIIVNLLFKFIYFKKLKFNF